MLALRGRRTARAIWALRRFPPLWREVGRAALRGPSLWLKVGRAALRGPSLWREVWWALRAGRRARRQLASGGLAALRLPVPPAGAKAPTPSAGRWLPTLLALLGESCLTIAAVRQAWLAGADERRDLVLGVARAEGSFKAHAWLDGDPPAASKGFTEIARLAPSDDAR